MTAEDAGPFRPWESDLDEDDAPEMGAGALSDVRDEVGAEVLDDVERFAGQFVAFPTRHHLVALCLWIAHTWALIAFYVTPRLVLESPEPGSGKTRVLEVLALLCRGAKLTLSTTTAALYRRIAAAGDEPPTVLQDEADAVFNTRTKTPQSEDVRALFNSGYKRGATVDRCEGDAKNMRVIEFPVFAPVALAFLGGHVPPSIRDRAISLHMRRRAPDEHLAEFRGRDAAIDAEPLRDRLRVWADANLDALTDARPAMPEGVRDRPAEVWEALLSIADVAGGEWPQRAREACRHFVVDTDADEKLSFGLRLLRDVRTVFSDRDRMFSAEIVSALTAEPESDSRDLWGKPLDQNRLAKELKRYGVRSLEIRIGDANRKGYLVDGDTGLGQAWHRYLPDVGSRDSRDGGATTETASDVGLFDNVAPVAPVTPTDGRTSRDGFDSPTCRYCGAELTLPSAAARGYCSRAKCLDAHQQQTTGAS
jgi:hypothetical protein